jgi:hypothetical protein
VVLSANGQRDERQRLDVGISVASQKELCCAPEAPSWLVLEEEVSGEIARSAELLLGRRERIGKQVLFVL